MIKQDPDTYERNLAALQLDYSQVFSQDSPHTMPVLKDLAKFCRAFESTFNPDPRLHAVLEGRREVWLKIMEYLNFDFKELYDLHVIKGNKNVRARSNDRKEAGSADGDL